MSHLLRGAKFASKQVSYLLLILAMVFLLALASLQWLSYSIEQRKDEIAQFLSLKLKRPVTLGSAELEQSGFVPKLHIDKLKLLGKHSGTELLTLDSLDFGIDIVKSIQYQEPVLADIAVNGIKAKVTRDETGSFTFAGINLSSTSGSTNKIDWFSLLEQFNQISVNSVAVDFQDTSRPGLSGQYILDNAVLDHNDDVWSLLALVQLPESVGSSLSIELNALAGEKLSTSTWSGKMSTQRLSSASLAQFKQQKIAVKRGYASINASLSGQGAMIEQANAVLELSDIELAPLPNQTIVADSVVAINKLTSELDWHKTHSGWQFNLSKLHIDMNEGVWPETNFSLIKTADEWLIKGNYLRLGDVSSLALLTGESPEIIRLQQPAGDVNNLMIRLSSSEGLEALAFNLKQASLLPWKNNPGISGLTGSIEWIDDTANIELNSEKFKLYPDTWIDRTMLFDSVKGNLVVQSNGTGLYVKSDKLRVSNDDFNLQLDGSFNRLKSGSIKTDIHLAIEDMQVNSWKHYVPLTIFEPDLKKWIEPAFVKGIIKQGKITLQGDLANFPFDKPNEEGLFQMALNVENMHLHYAPDWPDITETTATINGIGNDLVIKSKKGKIAGFNFVDMTTTISRLMITKPVLRTFGKLAGTTEQGLQFLRNSPLKQRFSRAIEGVSAEGNTNIDLNLLVPLTNVNSAQADGKASFLNSTLSHKDFSAVVINNINGELKFNNDGVETEQDIQALLLNENITVAVKPSENKTLVTMNGVLATESINSVWPEAVPNFISGKTEYTARLNVKEKQLGDFYVDGDIKSNLIGIEVNLPQPLLKKQNDQTKFNIAMELNKTGTDYSLNYADFIHIIANNNSDQWRSKIMIGGKQALLPAAGHHVAGELADLSLSEWGAWLKSQPEKEGKSVLSELDSVSLAVASLSGFGQQLNDVNVSMNKLTDAWQITIASKETNGKIYLPDNLKLGKPLDITLDKLVLTLPEESQSADDDSVKLWPSVNISIGELTIEELNLGQFDLSATQRANTWLLDSATIQTQQYTISGTGRWQQNQTSDLTQLSLNINSDNLGEALARLGYLRSIEGENFVSHAQLNMPASPLGFARELLDGQADFRVEKGTLNDVQPGAAGRVFGLMSITALPRRLSLDFSELFDKGFKFDVIKASFNMNRGVAHTDDFVLNGPSANVTIVGKVDLVKQQYDQEVKITPNVSSTLPLAGAVAGGPLGLGVGAALFAVDKLSGNLFGKNIVNLISYRYSLTGPWNNPDFSVVQ